MRFRLIGQSRPRFRSILDLSWPINRQRIVGSTAAYPLFWIWILEFDFSDKIVTSTGDTGARVLSLRPLHLGRYVAVQNPMKLAFKMRDLYWKWGILLTNVTGPALLKPCTAPPQRQLRFRSLRYRRLLRCHYRQCRWRRCEFNRKGHACRGHSSTGDHHLPIKSSEFFNDIQNSSIESHHFSAATTDNAGGVGVISIEDRCHSSIESRQFSTEDSHLALYKINTCQ